MTRANRRKIERWLGLLALCLLAVWIVSSRLPDRRLLSRATKLSVGAWEPPYYWLSNDELLFFRPTSSSPRPSRFVRCNIRTGAETSLAALSDLFGKTFKWKSGW